MGGIDPITLLIILFFVIGPIINSFLKRPETPPRPRPKEAPGDARPQRPPSQQASARPAPSREAPTSFEARLEEARRRVQEAMAQDSSASAPAQQRPDAPRRAPPGRQQQRPLVSPLEQARLPRTPVPTAGYRDDGYRDDGYRDEMPGAATLARRDDQSRQPARTSPPLETVRRGARSLAKINLDADSLKEAVLWREILNEPLSKRRRRP